MLYKRYKNIVGKYIGGKVYVHKEYAHEVIPRRMMDFALDRINKLIASGFFIDDFKYNCVMWDKKRGVVRFDPALDFDRAREPHVGRFISINLDGSIKSGHSDYIWHHKWMWVKDDYNGFGVEESKAWSKLWTSQFLKPAKCTDSSFNKQLQANNLGEFVL
jgi:hypothetical protein